MSNKFASPAEIKVGTIGYGGAYNMGRAHLNEMKRAGMTPTAVCELDLERLKVAQEEFPGIETYTSIDEMLEKSEVNLIAIITPHNLHAEQAIKVLKSGRSVVCEKPLAITTEECDAMIDAAVKNNVILSTYHNRHWDGWILKAMEIINAGTIGDVFRVEAHMGGYSKPGDWWRGSKTFSGGILYDWGVHLLEYGLQMLGSAKMQEVSGYARQGFWADQTKWKADTIEDEAFASVRFSDNRWLTLQISTLESNPRRGMIQCTGTLGSLTCNGDCVEVYTNTNNSKVTTTYPNPPGEGYKFYQNIADHLVNDEDLIITAEWSRRPIHILDLAGKSAAANSAIKTKYE